MQGWRAGVAGWVARVPTLVLPVVAGVSGLVAGAYGGAPLRGAAEPAVAITAGALWAGVVGGLGTVVFGLFALGAARSFSLDPVGRRGLARSVAFSGWTCGLVGLAGAIAGGWAGTGGSLGSLRSEAALLAWMSLPAPFAGMALAAALWLTSVADRRR
jgi:hypothetical protein